MILNSKGKLFGKVSIIDIIIIILVIAAIAGAYLRLSSKDAAVGQDTVDIYYEMVIEDIRETNKNFLEKSVGTEFFLEADEQYPHGILQDVKITEAVNHIELSDGSVINATVPEKYDVVLTLKFNGYEKDDGYYTTELKEISPGRTYNLCNKYCSINGMVDKIWK